MLSTGLANVDVTCNDNELVQIIPPSNQSCQEYLGAMISQAGGYLQDQSATSECSYCPIDKTNTFLDSVNSSYANRWRDFGIGMVYIVFNIAAAVFFYWLARMPKGRKNKKKKQE